jgi:hypothetical protein
MPTFSSKNHGSPAPVFRHARVSNVDAPVREMTMTEHEVINEKNVNQTNWHEAKAEWSEAYRQACKIHDREKQEYAITQIENINMMLGENQE